jgi:hypothetical protein
LNRGHLTYEELWALPRTQAYEIESSDDLRKMLYILVFPEMAKVDGENGKYGGKTIQAGNCLTSHSNNLTRTDPPSGHMYSYGRTAEAFRMLLFTDLGSVPVQQRHSVIQIAEQTLVCLFQSTTPVLFRQFEDPDQLIKYYFGQRAGQMFAELSSRVFARTGWQGLAGRGLNWTSLMMEVLLRHTAWTCQEIPLSSEVGNKVRVYHRQPLTVAKKLKGALILLLIAGGKDRRGQVIVTIPRETGIRLGMKATPVVEIYMGEAKRHTCSFARAPEPGPFSDWKYLNRVCMLAVYGLYD